MWRCRLTASTSRLFPTAPLDLAGVEHLERSGMNRPTNEYDQSIDYEIRIKGHLDRRWTDRFNGLSMRYEADGTTVLNGPVADQAALHGLLQRVRDMGLQLISVTQVKTDQPDSPGIGAG
jgi:hypothetical protein